MVSKEKRLEVWKTKKAYMDNKGTIKDLLPCCLKCNDYSPDVDPQEWCQKKDTCPIFQLWLSNSYLEWCESWRNEI